MSPSEFQELKKQVNDGPLQLRVASGSMEPLLKTNDLVTVSKNRGKLNNFDVVVYYFAGQIRCHFLWRDQLSFNKTIVTRSLEDFFSDETPIPQNNILGVLTEVKISSLTRWKIILLDMICFWKSR